MYEILLGVEMKTFKDLIELSKIQLKIAKDVWPNGTLLKCSICGKEQQASSDDCGYYLRCGWPKCCQKTMGIVE